jgi:hypothetical protein
MMTTETTVKAEETSAKQRQGTWTQKAGDPETWVRDIMIPHFRAPHLPHIFGAGNGRPRLSEIEELSLNLSRPNPITESRPALQAHPDRRRALILPREHGAWGLLLVPMVTGAGIAVHETTHIVPFLLLLTSALALFWLRTPVESLLGTSVMRAQTDEERDLVKLVIAGLGAAAALSLAALLWAGRNPALWLIGGAAAAAFLGQAFLKSMSKQSPRLSRNSQAAPPPSKESIQNLRMLSEMVGTIGLTLSAPAAYYVMTGKLGLTAGMLWFANLLFAGDQIHYVQFRIHTARVEGLRAKLAHGRGFAIGQALMTAALTIACLSRLMPAIASVAFAPLLFRGWFYFVQDPKPLVVRRLGWNELTHAIAFCVLFIGAFALAK